MRKIIDCFTFFNELDLLEIRLRYLYDTVDHFVIIEADKTHKGNDKPAILQENLARFAPYKDKMIYKFIAMKSFEDEKKVAWKRENYQRDCIEQGLKELQLKDNDLLLVSDLDEIPDKAILKALKENKVDTISQTISRKSNTALLLKIFPYLIKRIRYKFFDKDKDKYRAQLLSVYYTVFKGYDPPLNFSMANCFYYMNYLEKETVWPGIQCAEARWLKVLTANDIRILRHFPLATINNSGWHFSYLGGKEVIKYKLKNFAHQEFNIPQIVSDDYIDFCINNGYSLFEYYKNPNIKPTFEKKPITYLPAELQEAIGLNKQLLIA